MKRYKLYTAITYTTIVLALIVATFIEKFYDSKMAYSLVFGNYILNFLWAAGLLLLLWRISKYKFNRRNSTVVLIHLSLAMILLGGMITRMFGNTGYIYLKQGETVMDYVQTNSFNNDRKLVSLPFKLTLNKFEIEHYRGSLMPSSFKSYVTVQNKKSSGKVNAEIFMNHPFKYKKFRVYQASYDDNNGVVLSVNNDFYGILVTYLAYLFAVLSIVASLFNKSSLIRRLMSHRLLKEKSLIIVFLVSLALGAQANDLPGELIINKESAEQIGNLWAQDGKGRIKPLNTIASDVSIKLTKKRNFMGLTPEQFFLSVIRNPYKWNTIKLFKVGSDSIKTLLHISTDRASIEDLTDREGVYKLSHLHVELMKKGANTNKLEKEILSLGERINVYFMLQVGDFFRVFPQKDKINAPWLAPSDPVQGVDKMDSLLIKKSLLFYFNLIDKNKYGKAGELIQGITNYQHKFAKMVLPSDFKRVAEVNLNKYQPFSKLFKIYATIGFLIVIFFYISLLKGKSFKLFNNIAFIALALLSLIHLIALTSRSIIAGHAPFSNGYEIMLSLSLLSLWISFFLKTKTSFMLGVGAIFSALCLLVANFSFMNPEITKLVPILKSTWLSIHVATIIIGYTFAGLATISALFNLFLSFFITAENRARLVVQFKKVTILNKIFIWFGIYFMFIGIITGAVWANESWGNYWSWDPKETWALITLFVYAMLAHLKKVKEVNFNIYTVIAFSSVLITYFGVNYYFGGKHAYASGSVGSMILPFVITFVLLFGISLIAKRKFGRE